MQKNSSPALMSSSSRRLRRGAHVSEDDENAARIALQQKAEEEESERERIREEVEERALEGLLDETYLAISASTRPTATSNSAGTATCEDLRPDPKTQRDQDVTVTHGEQKVGRGEHRASVDGADEQEPCRRQDQTVDLALDAAEVMWRDGRLEDALEALAVLLDGGSRLANHRGDQGVVVTRIALLYEEMGDVAKALEFHFRRLDIAMKQAGSDGQKAQIRCYNNIAFLYLKQGKDVLFRTYSDKSEHLKREMLRIEVESRKGSRSMASATATNEASQLEQEKKQKQKQMEEEVAIKRLKEEQAELKRIERLNVENEGLVKLIAALKVPIKQREETHIFNISSVLDSIDYFHRRTNEHQRRELCRLALYESHIEAFNMYEPGDPADRAWVMLGCTPFLEDYKGSVDIMEWDEETTSEVVSNVVHAGSLFGEEALDGASVRTNRAVVSDDGHDDVITTNHFLTIKKEDFEEVINTYYHSCFEVHPDTRELDCKYANLGDSGAAELSWFLINSRNKVLMSLDLQMNNIGVEGAHHVADLLSQNHAITTLEISHNHIGDVGATDLCTALSSNTTLTSLSLRANHLTNRSGPAIQEMLDFNTVLTSIDLKDNSICYTEAVSQLSNYAKQRKYTLQPDQSNDFSLIKLAQSRERRAHEAELAIKKEPLRGLSASTVVSSKAGSSVNSVLNGWKDRQRRFGAHEEAHESYEIEAVIRRIKVSLSSSRNYQFRTNTEGYGVVKRECLRMDIKKRRTLLQQDLIAVFSRFDVKILPDDAADLSLCFGYLPYRAGGEDSPGEKASTPATGRRTQKTGRMNSTARSTTGTSGSSRSKTPSTSGQSRNGPPSRQKRDSIRTALSAISSKAEEAEPCASRPNDLLVVWPCVVDAIEGGCSQYIEEFYVFEKLDRDRCELEAMLEARMSAGNYDDIGHIKEELDRIKSIAVKIQGF